MSSKIRTIRRSIIRTHTEQDYRGRYAAYKSAFPKGKPEGKPLSYRRWLAEQKAPKEKEEGV